jgi:glycerol kinase
METPRLVGALDQGTTSSRFMIFDQHSHLVAKHQLEHRQSYPAPGQVEHDPLEIWRRSAECIQGALERAGLPGSALAAIGITNQRETTVVWDPATGQPWHPAIVWQDTRTDAICQRLAQDSPAADRAGLPRGQNRFQAITGLPLATYFSGPKLAWLLEHVEGLRAAAEEGRALFGTIDSWLVWQLTGGPDGGRHVTDVSNASRTMLVDLATLDWDPLMLEVFGIPRRMLPRICPSSDPEAYGRTSPAGPFGTAVPIGACLGDQQAALFGQTCFRPGEAKNTYGTGCFLLMNTGTTPVRSANGLLTTVAYRLGTDKPVYALEGSVAMAGALVQWCRDQLGLIHEAAEINELAATVPDSGGVYLVPAFSGLFAPHWRADARGLLIGLTHYVGRAHIARAVLEATAYQSGEIFEVMQRDSGLPLASLKVDGGMAASALLMQFQADILGLPVRQSLHQSEVTGLGAAYAAGLARGVWAGLDELAGLWREGCRWESRMGPEERRRRVRGWKRAVERSFAWLEADDVAE